ncbi:MAG: Ig-like domain-containing protein [Bacteroidales bacterium]|nr:Ig-like domain-containing protein [Bacteroidales bacterium]
MTALTSVYFVGCASIGSPGGGLYDETPPVLRNSEPGEGATRVKKQKITMHFDENIKLNDALKKLTVSPPQEKSPIILSNAKTLTIELQDSLKPNTTYSIDLGDAVQDNNEGNPMESLSLLFSTGDVIDSLQISGYLLNAADLEPITGAYVGIYNEEDNTLGDSIFMQRPMERAGKTDAYGAFHILGCAPGKYRLFALTDENTNFRYDLTSENIAFSDSLISPSADSMQVLMLAFNEGKVNRYLDNCVRRDSIHIDIRFAARMDSLPILSFIGNDGSLTPANSLLIAEINPTRDTLSYWIRDSLYYQSDTLLLSLTYMFTDTTGLDVPRTDTLSLYKPVQRAQTDKKEDKKEKKGGMKRLLRKKEENKNDSTPALPAINFITIRQIAGQSLNIGDKPRFEISSPIDSIHLERLHLQYKQDTLWKDLAIDWVPDSLHPRRYTLLARPHYTPGTTYQLVVDSAAMKDIYGNPNDRTILGFKEKSNEEYAHLLFTIEGITEPAFIELLNAKDLPVQSAPVKEGQAKFVHVNPGQYFARLVIDKNGNGLFDTGNLGEHRHPEPVYYLHAPLKLRANWTIQQNWNPTELPLLQQKPEEVKINKPKEKREKASKNEEYLRKHGK